MKETYYLITWMGGHGFPCWQQVTYFEYCREDFTNGYLSTFRGKRGTVAVMTYDTEITRAMKLKVAEDFMNGNYITTEIDLNGCSSSTVAGTAH